MLPTFILIKIHLLQLLFLSVIKWFPIRWFTLRDLHGRICRARILKSLDHICNIFRDLNDSKFLCVCNNWIYTKWWIYVTPHAKMNGWFNFNINNQRKKVFEARKMRFSKFTKELYPYVFSDDNDEGGKTRLIILAFGFYSKEKS